MAEDPCKTKLAVKTSNTIKSLRGMSQLKRKKIISYKHNEGDDVNSSTFSEDVDGFKVRGLYDIHGALTVNNNVKYLGLFKRKLFISSSFINFYKLAFEQKLDLSRVCLVRIHNGFILAWKSKIYRFLGDNIEEWIGKINFCNLKHSEIYNSYIAPNENSFCGNCREKNSTYVLLNFGMTLCDDCAEKFANLQIYCLKISKISQHKWKFHDLELLAQIGNKRVSTFFDAFLNKKNLYQNVCHYVEEKFSKNELFSDGVQELAKNSKLVEVIQNNDAFETLKLILSGAEVNYKPKKNNPKNWRIIDYAFHSGQGVQFHLLVLNDGKFYYVGYKTSNLFIAHNIMEESVEQSDEINTTNAYFGQVIELSNPEKTRMSFLLDDEKIIIHDIDKPANKIESSGREIENFTLTMDSTGKCSIVLNLQGKYVLYTQIEEDTFKCAKLLMTSMNPYMDLKIDFKFPSTVVVVYLKENIYSNWRGDCFLLHDGDNLQFVYDEANSVSLPVADLAGVNLSLTKSDCDCSEKNYCIFVDFHEKNFYVQCENKKATFDLFHKLREALNTGERTFARMALYDNNIVAAVHKCLQYVEANAIQQVGIYRLSGFKAKSVELTKNLLSHCPSVDLELYGIHEITDSIKEVLGSQSDALLPIAMTNSLINITRIKDCENKINSYSQILSDLPPANLFTLRALVYHLINVSKHNSANNMDLANLASMFSCLLKFEASSQTHPILKIQLYIAIVLDLLTNADKIFQTINLPRNISDKYYQVYLKENRRRSSLKLQNRPKSWNINEHYGEAGEGDFADHEKRESVEANNENLDANEVTEVEFHIFNHNGLRRIVNVERSTKAEDVVESLAVMVGLESPLWCLSEVISGENIIRKIGKMEKILDVKNRWEDVNNYFCLIRSPELYCNKINCYENIFFNVRLVVNKSPIKGKLYFTKGKIAFTRNQIREFSKKKRIADNVFKHKMNDIYVYYNYDLEGLEKNIFSLFLVVKNYEARKFKNYLHTLIFNNEEEFDHVQSVVSHFTK